jgi:DeoR/GlpR family transcriptional regulator of sugar metabolism
VNPRLAWAMTEVKRGFPLRRSHVVAKFGVSDSTAKRDLHTLTMAGKIERYGSTKTGYYRLKGAGN